MAHFPFLFPVLDTELKLPLCGFLIRPIDGLFDILFATISGFPTASLAASSKTTFTPAKRKEISVCNLVTKPQEKAELYNCATAVFLIFREKTMQQNTQA